MMTTYYSYDGCEYDNVDEVYDAIWSNVDDEDLEETMTRTVDFSELWKGLSDELKTEIFEETVNHIFENYVSEWYEDDEEEDEEDDEP